MKRILLSFTVALALSFQGCQTTNTEGSDRFVKGDANHDNKLSLDEANVYIVASIFDSRDVNYDERMTLKEWTVAGDEGQAKAFHERDADHDGVVTFAEALAYGRKKGDAAKLVKEADLDKDGYLSREEVEAYYAKREGPRR